MTNSASVPQPKPLDPAKFRHPDVTAKGERRAEVRLRRLETLWFNTGTLCNLTCANCYIESSPTNDRLVYLSVAEVADYLDEIAGQGLGTREIGFTGGEPFMNPDIIAMLADALNRGFKVLVLTNAMRPMMKLAEPLLALRRDHGERLTIRVSLDHYGRALHERERGRNTFEKTILGLRWLIDNGFRTHVAGRTYWGEPEDRLRAGYARLFVERGIAIDSMDSMALVLFPEMDPTVDVPEITEACWGILHKNPDAMMCASSRMVVKRKGAAEPAVLACTLLPYDTQFELGRTLAEASGAVKLNHPHCAKFCVLGGGSCSVAGPPT
jgi:uncharacterized Fe-S cluster-containing radical SAM superfamily protein